MSTSSLKNPMHEYRVFWKRLVKNPKNLGAVLPSSRSLASFIGDYVAQANNKFVVELGPGTGRFTEQILKLGLKNESFACVELDTYLCDFLRKNFRDLNIFQGDARNLETILPSPWIGKVTTIVSGIPLMNLSKKVRIDIIEACFKVLEPEGRLLQFTYNPLPLVPPEGFTCKKIGIVWTNLPPAVLWSFERIQNVTV